MDYKIFVLFCDGYAFCGQEIYHLEEVNIAGNFVCNKDNGHSCWALACFYCGNTFGAKGAALRNSVNIISAVAAYDDAHIDMVVVKNICGVGDVINHDAALTLNANYSKYAVAPE